MLLDNAVVQILVGGFFVDMLATLLGAIFLGWKTRHYNEVDEFSHLAELLNTDPLRARYAFTEIERKGMPHTFENLQRLTDRFEVEALTVS